MLVHLANDMKYILKPIRQTSLMKASSNFGVRQGLRCKLSVWLL